MDCPFCMICRRGLYAKERYYMKKMISNIYGSCREVWKDCFSLRAYNGLYTSFQKSADNLNDFFYRDFFAIGYLLTISNHRSICNKCIDDILHFWGIGLIRVIDLPIVLHSSSDKFHRKITVCGITIK